MHNKVVINDPATRKNCRYTTWWNIWHRFELRWQMARCFALPCRNHSRNANLHWQ